MCYPAHLRGKFLYTLALAITYFRAYSHLQDHFHFTRITCKHIFKASRSPMIRGIHIWTSLKQSMLMLKVP